MVTKAELEQRVAELEAQLTQPETTAVERPAGRVIELPDMNGAVPSQYRHRYNLNLIIDKEDATALGRLADSLDRSQARLKSGRRIVDRRNAARWLLEKLSRVLVDMPT